MFVFGHINHFLIYILVHVKRIVKYWLKCNIILNFILLLRAQFDIMTMQNSARRKGVKYMEKKLFDPATITIDGRMDEPQWAEVQEQTGFYLLKDSSLRGSYHCGYPLR